MGLALDSYSLRARVVPFVAVFVPPIVMLGAGIVTTTGLGIATGTVMLVIGALAGQLGRDRGKALEPKLWTSWGGSPTLQRLRYRGSLSEGRVDRLHARIATVLGEQLPTKAEETADPTGADERYEEVSARVRALTRDQSRFPLLFAENVNYGQRRNLLGLRPAGIVVAVLTAVVAGLMFALADGSASERAARYGPAVAVGLIVLLFWISVVRPSWVRTTAEAYAEQFIGAIDLLHA